MGLAVRGTAPHPETREMMKSITAARSSVRPALRVRLNSRRIYGSLFTQYTGSYVNGQVREPSSLATVMYSHAAYHLIGIAAPSRFRVAALQNSHSLAPVDHSNGHFFRVTRPLAHGVHRFHQAAVIWW